MQFGRKSQEFFSNKEHHFNEYFKSTCKKFCPVYFETELYLDRKTFNTIGKFQNFTFLKQILLKSLGALKVQLLLLKKGIVILIQMTKL